MLCTPLKAVKHLLPEATSHPEKVSGENKWPHLPLIMLKWFSIWPDSHASVNSWIELVGSERLQHFTHSYHQSTQVNNSSHASLCSSQCILVLFMLQFLLHGPNVFKNHLLRRCLGFSSSKSWVEVLYEALCNLWLYRSDVSSLLC